MAISIQSIGASLNLLDKSELMERIDKILKKSRTKCRESETPKPGMPPASCDNKYKNISTVSEQPVSSFS